MQGRTGYYGPEHVARLELTARLQDQGLSLVATARLIANAPRLSAEEALTHHLQM